MAESSIDFEAAVVASITAHEQELACHDIARATDHGERYSRPGTRDLLARDAIRDSRIAISSVTKPTPSLDARPRRCAKVLRAGARC